MVFLTQQQMEVIRERFNAFDKDLSGEIDVWELKAIFEEMGQKPTDPELFQLIAEVDSNKSGTIDFEEFVQLIENQKAKSEKFDTGNEMVEAFVACGGQRDKTGFVKREDLTKIVRDDFGLEYDMDRLIDTVDKDGSGEIDFEEFAALLSGEFSGP